MKTPAGVRRIAQGSRSARDGGFGLGLALKWKLGAEPAPPPRPMRAVELLGEVKDGLGDVPLDALLGDGVARGDLAVAQPGAAVQQEDVALPRRQLCERRLAVINGQEFRDSETSSGVRLGVGAEIPISGPVLLMAEYRYSDYGSGFPEIRS